MINFGLRGNYATVLKTSYLEPRILIETYMSNMLKAKFSFERQHQNTSQVIEFNTRSFGLENQVWALSDDEFFPLLKNNQWSSGLSFNNNGWTVDTEFYIKKPRD